ncbi:MAG: hypothetical protein LBP50_09295 [Tannerella sp.]|jgi:hypothetical protein|nr:hypothetical protein [Tannerella sp.]
MKASGSTGDNEIGRQTDGTAIATHGKPDAGLFETVYATCPMKASD